MISKSRQNGLNNFSILKIEAKGFSETLITIH